jgi:hypothetical protein
MSYRNKYDLLVYFKGIPFVEDLPWDFVPIDEDRLILRLQLTLKKAMLVLRELEDKYEWLYILLVPVAYRDSRISLETAQSIAQEELDKLNKPDGTTYVLSSGFDQVLWWEFYANTAEIIDSGEIQEGGGYSICIDKIDGHMRDAEEWAQWVGLSRKQNRGVVKHSDKTRTS